MNKRNLKISSFILAVVFLVSFILPAVTVFAHDKHHGDEMVDIIVRYYEDVPDEEELDSSFENIRTSKNRPVQAMTVPASKVKELMENENIEQIRYNQKVTPSETAQETESSEETEPEEEQPEETQSQEAQFRELNSQDWNNEMVNAFEAWNDGYTGAGISVAVLDTGFYADHNDINFSGGISVFDDDPWYNDHSGHGTHVAGTIGALAGTTHQGIAPDVNLLGVKIYHQDDNDENGNDTTDIFNLTEGLNAAISMSPDIILISSGFSGGDSDLHEEIREAVENGILIVAASGNGKAEVDYPAAYDEVVSVTSIDQNQYPASDIIYGYENDFTAPGVNIGGLSIPESPRGYPYATLSGSSHAAPHVVGIAAILMQKYDLPASEILAIMQEDALDLNNPGFYGHGLIQYVSDNDPDDEEEPEDPDDDEEDEPTEPEEPNDDNETSPPDNEDESNSNNGNGSGSEENDSENGSNGENEETQEDENEDDEDDEETDDENEEDDLSSAVWIRPSNSNGIATIEDSDLEAIADNGTIALSFDSSINHLTHVAFTAEQVAEIRERGIAVLIAKTEIEWVIPSENFEEGDAILRFEFPENELPLEEEATSNVYQFIFSQNGEERVEFSEDMIYRFFVDNPEENGEILYEWVTNEEEWIELGNTYSNGAVVGSANYTGTFCVFQPDVLAQDNRNIIDSGRVEAAAPGDENDDSEENQNSIANSSSYPLAYTLGGAAVIGLSLAGGFYYFGRNKAD